VQPDTGTEIVSRDRASAHQPVLRTRRKCTPPLHQMCARAQIALKATANGPQRTRAPLLANGGPDVAAARFSAHLTHSYCLQVKCVILTASLQVTYSKSPLSTGKVRHDSRSIGKVSKWPTLSRIVAISHIKNANILRYRGLRCRRVAKPQVLIALNTAGAVSQ
jgi:hypothetical protein